MTASAPYPGLRPFHADEVDVFFGREPQIDQLLERLGRGRLLAVVGSSGCGKSSLVKAGLIPALETGFLASAGARWRVAEMRPGNQPLRRLAAALLSDSALGAERADQPGALGFVLANLRRGPLGLAEVLTDTPPPEGTRLLLLVDQFEEIFRYFEHGDSDEADAFVALLLAAVAQPGVPIYVVLTMRSDYLGDCALFEGLPEALNESQFLTPRMPREQRREAIVGPAAVFGARVEPALVNRLLNDMGADPDQLPLMQHVLMRLWHRSGRRAEGGAASSEVSLDRGIEGSGQTVLTVADYEAVGGFVDALSNHADEAYEELNEEGRRIATRLFRALSERGDDQRDTRRPARLGEVAEVAAAAPDRVAAVAEAFRRPGRSFLTPPAAVPLAPDTVLDVSHESLIRRWRRLRRWVEEESLSASLYRRLSQTADLWRRGQAGLWGPPDLDIALSWQERQRPTAAWAARYGGGFEVATEFLAASRDKRREDEEQARQSLVEAEQQRRVRQRNRVLTLGLALAAALLLLAFSQWRRADRQRNLAQRQTLLAEAGTLIAHAGEALEDRPQRSLLLAVEALALEREAGGGDGAGIQALQKGLGASGGRALIRHQGTIVALEISRDGRRLASASSDGTTRIVDLAAAQREDPDPAASADGAGTDSPVRVLDGHPGGVLALDLEPAGRWLATGGADGMARVWDLDSADPAADPRLLAGHQEAVTALAFSGGDRLTTGDGAGTVRLWDLSAGREVPPLELGRHADAVRAIAASRGGRWVASVSEDNTVALWDLAAADPAGSRVDLLGHRGPVASAIFSPDDRWLATAGHDNTVRLWSLSDPGQAPVVLCGHDGSVVSLAITPDGGWLISGSSDATARLWRLPALITGAAARRRARSQSIIAAAEPDRCRQLLEVAGPTGVLWDLRDLRPAPTVRLTGHHDTVTALASSPSIPGLERRFLATASRDHTVRVWNLTTEEPGMTSLLLRGHDSAVSALAFSPSAPFLYSGGAASVRLWNLELADRNLLSILLSGPRDAVRDLALSPDARWLAAGGDDNHAYLWDIGRFQPPQRLSGHDSSISRVGISPDNRWLVTTSEDNTIRLWDLSTQVGAEGLPFVPGLPPALPRRRAGPTAPRAPSSRVLAGNASSVTSLAFTPDGRRLITAGRDGTARVWSLEAADPALAPTVLCGHSDAIVDLAVSADGRWLASASSTAVRLWDLPALEPLLPTADGRAPLLATALSAGECRRKTVAGDTLETREVAAGAARRLAGGEGGVTAVAFVPAAAGGEPRWLAIGDDHGTVRLWPPGSAEAEVAPLAISPGMGGVSRIVATVDGRWLAIAGEGDTAGLVDLSVEPGRRILVLRDHRDAVTALAFSRDSHWLATGSADGEARLWDLTAQRPEAVPGVLYGHRGSVTSVVFAPDSEWLATGSRDHTVRVWSTFLWSLPPERLIDLACRVAGRDLTPDEWAEYLPGRAYSPTCSVS